jgi:hypothetical protein
MVGLGLKRRLKYENVGGGDALMIALKAVVVLMMMKGNFGMQTDVVSIYIHRSSRPTMLCRGWVPSQRGEHHRKLEPVTLRHCSPSKDVHQDHNQVGLGKQMIDITKEKGEGVATSTGDDVAT